ncbi:MAG: type II secretion system protein [Planctomycetes bacterium]|nr:type II secretion system protein [Planctomycetota bacterium]
MKKAFTLIEILIMVSILGILASIVIPRFQSHTAEAKESTAKVNLRTLRNAIDLYATRNSGVAPGYSNNDPSQAVGYRMLSNHLLGDYFYRYPKNPFNDSRTFYLIQNNADFPSEAITGDLTFGWVYKAATKTIRLNTAGTDSSGVRYFDY